MALTTITGTLTLPDGTPYNGSLFITWGGIPWQADDGTLVPAGPGVTTQVKNGAVSVELRPTDGTTVPTPIYYYVQARGTGPATVPQIWQVPTSGSPVTLSSVIVPATSGPPIASGITTLNGLAASVQLFARTNDTNVTLAWSSVTATHTLTAGWTGQLAPARGGTGDDTSAVTGVPIITGGNWTYDAEAQDLTNWPVGVSNTEVGYLDGVTSAIQTQLDAKAATAAIILGVGNLTTTGAVPYVSASGTLNQDSGLTWEPTNNELTLAGTTTIPLYLTTTQAQSFMKIVSATSTARGFFGYTNLGSGGVGLLNPGGSAAYWLTVGTTGNTLISGDTDGNYKLDVQASGSAGTLRVYDQTATTGVTVTTIRQGAGQNATPFEIQDAAGVVKVYSDYTDFSLFSEGGFKDQNSPSTFALSNANSGLALGSAKEISWSSDTTFFGAKDTGLARNAAGVVEVNNGTPGTLRDIIVRSSIGTATAAADASLANSQFMLVLTSNTNLQIRAKGSDGTVRFADITLAP